MAAHAELYKPRRRKSARAKRKRFLERLAAADRAAQTHLVLSHGHCLDGTGSVIVARHAFGDGVGVLYIQPNQVLHTLRDVQDLESRDRTLIIADLSLDPNDYDAIVDACRGLRELGWTIEWLDHHHKQWEGLDLDRLREHVQYLEVNDDATESGASLMQKRFAPKDAFARKLAETIRDRDLWWNKTPDSETLEHAISWMGETEFDAHMTAKTGRNKVVDDTIAAAADQQRRLVEEQAAVLLSDVRESEAPSGDKVAVVSGWLPKNVGLHRVLQRDSVRVAINIRPGGTMSLRSEQEWPVCQEVAKQFNGGGHPNASGGKLRMSRIAAWWYVLRRGRTPLVDRLTQAAVDAVQDEAERK